MIQVPPAERDIVGMVPAAPGWKVDAYAPKGTNIGGIPTPSSVVAWVLVVDELAPGGSILEPVFVAGTRTWTPDQFRAMYGELLELSVVAA